MNVKELKALCSKINAQPLTWSAKAYHLTTELQAADVYFEESGYDADWRIRVGLNENNIASVRYNRGLKVSTR